jgi:hypothetical protein
MWLYCYSESTSSSWMMLCDNNPGPLFLRFDGVWSSTCQSVSYDDESSFLTSACESDVLGRDLLPGSTSYMPKTELKMFDVHDSMSPAATPMKAADAN